MFSNAAPGYSPFSHSNINSYAARVPEILLKYIKSSVYLNQVYIPLFTITTESEYVFNSNIHQARQEIHDHNELSEWTAKVINICGFHNWGTHCIHIQRVFYV